MVDWTPEESGVWDKWPQHESWRLILTRRANAEILRRRTLYHGKKEKEKNGTTLIKKVKECKTLVYDLTVGEELAI
jgi:hypothetical protein